MAWAPPEVAAAAPSWTPPEVVGAPAASGSDEAAAEGNPSDPYAGASAGASEAALSQATGALASIPAGVDYLTRRVGHLLAGGLGYGLAAGDPQKTQQMTDWLQQKATEDTCSFNDIQRFWTYAPTTPEGQAANASVGTALGQLTRPTRDVLSDVGVPSSITSKIPLPGPGTETALDIAGGALRASAALPVIGEIPHVPGLISDARAAQAAARAAKGADLGTTPMAGTSPRAPGTPLTGADLTAAPNPIPPPKPKITPKAGESAQAAAARQGILPEPPASSAAPAATPTPTAAPAATPARTFAPPSEEGPQPTATPNEQGARRQQLANLNQLAGGTLPNVRNSALTSDYTATGNDFQAAKTGSPTMQAQIATENDALQAAASNVHDAVGSTARDSVDTETLEQRGAAVRSAYQQIRDFFQGATNGLYDSARQMSGNNAIPQLGRVSAILGDDSEFASTDAIALQRAAQSRLTRLWSTGDPAGNVPPGSVAAAERFREFLNEQWSPGTSNLIGKLKDATDLDVAEHGGAGLFQAARNMRAHQARLLEDNPVVAKIIDRDNPVPVEKVMDHLTNAPREQFTDAVNTLRASAHLGGGELADPAAAAIREIKGHMVSRMHGAATNADGTWNARNFYARANQYATKAPAVFSPSEMRDLQILNRGGNILKMDKSYPGAAAQIQQAGGLRALAAPRIAGAVEGLATGWLGPAKGLLAEATGIAPAMRRGIERVVGGDTAAQREAAIAARITPLNLPGQRGSVRILNNNASGESAASLEAINRGTRNLALVRPDGSSVPVMRDVTQIDRGAPKGHVIVDRDTGEIVSRGADLNQSVANGLRNWFMSQRGSVRVTNPKVEAPQTELPLEGAEKPMINIGLHQGDPSAGGRVIPQEEAQAALKSAGVNIHRANVVNPPGGEPTLVASLDRKLTDPEANAVANKLGQLAIPQRGPMGEGSMHGPGVNSKEAIEQGWNKYNPDYFRMHNGETATEHAAKAGEFNPEQLESKQTVNNPIRNAYPGIYDDPHEILGRLNISHEDPALGEVFPGWSRERLFNEFGNREGDLPGKLPGEAANPRGSKAASSVMTPENATRIENILKAAKEYPNLYHGMVPWYAMDPLYDAVKSEIGPKGAPAAYSRLNTLMGMASPGSNVVTEIRRGTAAHMMAAKEKFGKFMKYGGQSSAERGPGYPPELAGVPGHPYHRTAQAMPMQQYLKTGSVQMRSPKVPMYIQASGVPETGFQTNTPIGDAHWSRGVGLSDVRTSASPASSVRTSEMSALAPWYREIAKRVGLTPVAAQALQWAALGGETGVETAVGAPKLELFAKEVKAAAKREGVEPKEMLKRIIRGMGRAG